MTIVDDAFWVARISYAEDTRPSRIDWRAAPTGSHCQPDEIDESLAARLLSLIRSYGLRFAAIDLVRDEHGEVYFLELNSTGQWGWLEMELGFPIRDALVTALCN